MENTTAQPKKYKIVLFTPQGIKTEIYSTETELMDFNNEMVKKYGTFITQSSKLITN